jgi:hypothetical protein
MWSLFINFMAWLGITMSPVELACDAAEPWQLGFQDAATQGTEIFFFFILLYIAIIYSLFLHFRKDALAKEKKTFVPILLFILVLVSVHCGLGLESLVAACDGGRGSSSVASEFHPAGEPREETPVESSSSSESLATFRNVIAAENENEIYRRIRHLESLDYCCLPPQKNPGDSERLVREHFDAAININHFREILDIEYFELQVLERKAILQDKLRNLMLSEPNIARIMDLSPYSNIQKEAFSFIEYKIEPVGDPRHAFQRHILDGCLNSFINGVNQQGRESMIYKEFYSHFTNEHFRRNHGLPLP